jgi:hypothetical protein
MHATQKLVADPVTPARVLRDAARYLLRHGWHQGDLFADLDRFEAGELLMPPACALGAIHVSVLGIPAPGEWAPETAAVFGAAVAALADHLILCQDGVVAHVGDVLDSDSQYMWEGLIGDWNDAPERIIGHVVAALFGAADEWDRLHPARPCRTSGGVA